MLSKNNNLKDDKRLTKDRDNSFYIKFENLIGKQECYRDYTINDEVHKYINEKRIKNSNNWWDINCEKFTRIARYAKKILSMPATALLCKGLLVCQDISLIN